MKKSLLLCALCLLMLACKPSADAITPDNWMSAYDDTTPICKISIPGSHDSGTTSGPDMLITQTATLAEQLHQGIRFFDIRLAKHGDRLGVFHAFAFQNIYWESDVLPLFIDFLKQNPSETLIVSVKKEGGEISDYSQLLSASLSDNDNRKYILDDFRSDITIGEARGKIIFFHRDYVMDDFPGAECRDWADDATCTMTLHNRQGEVTNVLLEDEYQHDSIEAASVKVKAVTDNLDRAAAIKNDNMTWAITFTSATGYPNVTPKAFADIVNRKVDNYLTAKQEGSFGIVVIDFTQNEDAQNVINKLVKIHSN